MQIHFKGSNYELNPEITEYARPKLRALKKFTKRAEETAHAYVDLGRIGDQSAGKVWRSEINFDAEGRRFRAEATEESLEAAIDVSVAELARELRSAKKRDESLARRGGALVKSLMRGFRTR